MNPPKAEKRAVAAWVLYDLANTIFSMGVISLFFPLWVRESVGAERADTLYGGLVALSMAITFLGAPLLGAWSDRARRRMPFLMVSTLACIGLTAAFGRFSVTATLVCFLLANVAYQAGVQIYDSLLSEVSHPANRGWIGGIGVGVGYFGSYVAVGLGLLFPQADKPTLFTLIALGFLFFSLPCFFLVREQGNAAPKRLHPGAFGEMFRQTLRTLRATEEYPGLLRFLIARALYTDAINTVILVMSLFAVNVAIASGLSVVDAEHKAKMIMLTAITFAIIGPLWAGRWVDRSGAKRTLLWVMGLWMLALLGGAAIGFGYLPFVGIFIVASMVGVAMGGTWTADRPLMLQMSPPERVGEFYGLYGMVGRFGAITGPAIWALVTRMAVAAGMESREAQACGILVLLAMIGVSTAILRKLPEGSRG